MEWDKEKAATILANYGAQRFAVDRDGRLFAVVGQHEFEVHGQPVYLGASAEEVAAAAVEKAKG